MPDPASDAGGWCSLRHWLTALRAIDAGSGELLTPPEHRDGRRDPVDGEVW